MGLEPEDLEKRVNKFCILELPGQPRSMHMGTSYLVNDLWKEVQRLRANMGVAIVGMAMADTTLKALTRIEADSVKIAKIRDWAQGQLDSTKKESELPIYLKVFELLGEKPE